jgi:hypothetical protein
MNKSLFFDILISESDNFESGSERKKLFRQKAKEITLSKL